MESLLFITWVQNNIHINITLCFCHNILLCIYLYYVRGMMQETVGNEAGLNIFKSWLTLSNTFTFKFQEFSPRLPIYAIHTDHRKILILVFFLVHFHFVIVITIVCTGTGRKNLSKYYIFSLEIFVSFWWSNSHKEDL